MLRGLLFAGGRVMDIDREMGDEGKQKGCGVS
jgi:hypothetical protein